MMSVHWAKADIRLRASGSDFDPRVRPVKANGGGWSNLWRLSAPDRWAWFRRANLELNTKSHLVSWAHCDGTSAASKLRVAKSGIAFRVQFASSANSCRNFIPYRRPTLSPGTADPTRGSLSHVSPLASSLTTKPADEQNQRR